MLWSHEARRERKLLVEPDSEGLVRPPSGGVTQSVLNEKAAGVWATASRPHYNLELRFNSQSLVVAMTQEPSVGGSAWSSVIFDEKDLEYPFALWCNSTLGILLHWWVANKTQSGRGRTTVTQFPEIPTLDVRALTKNSLRAARSAFDSLRDRWFLPLNQIDEDPARAELDKRLLVDVLDLPESLCATGGTIDLLRRKLANEPQIRGSKKSRVVFRESIDDKGQSVIMESRVKRSDR